MNSTLPDFFKSVLWSYDIALISPERDLRIILVPQALKLASLLFGVSEMRYVSRSTYIRDQKALAAAK